MECVEPSEVCDQVKFIFFTTLIMTDKKCQKNCKGVTKMAEILEKLKARIEKLTQEIIEERENGGDTWQLEQQKTSYQQQVRLIESRYGVK